MDEDQRKHLELIQAVITRMAGNSFLIRGWSVTLVSALFTGSKGRRARVRRRELFPVCDVLVS